MANATIIEHLTAFTVPNLSASWVVGRVKDGPREGIDPDALIHGSLTNNRPIVIRALAFTGSSQDVYTYLDDFYYRMHIIPPVVDFGAIANETDRTVHIWNAYFSTVALDDVSLSGEMTGVTISGLTPPSNFKGLEVKDIVFTVPAEGPPNVDGTITFTFSNGDEIETPAIGARARIWNRPPNWRDGVRIEYSFKTEILTTRSRREQRNALRMTPRKNVSFKVHGAFSGMRDFNAKMAQWMARPFILPEYPRSIFLDTGLAANDTTITVDPVPVWMREEMVVVLNNRDTYETRTIEDITGTTVTFTTSSSTVFPVGALLFPGLRAHIKDQINANMHSNSVLSADMKFDVDPAIEATYPTGEPDAEFNDREVWIMKNNWKDQISIDWNQFGETADFGRGRVDFFTPADFNQSVYKMTFLGKNNAEAEAILQFYYRMRGAQGEFYRPSYSPDLVPITQALAASVFLRFAGTDVYDVYATDKINKAVYIRMRNGDDQFNTVKELTIIEDPDGRDTLMEVDDPWGFVIDPDQVLFLSWMPVSRLASDTVTFEWVTSRVCNVQFSIQALEALAPEGEPT